MKKIIALGLAVLSVTTWACCDRLAIDDSYKDEKILGDLFNGFTRGGDVAENIGRAARESLERHGERQSNSARNRAERRFRDRVPDNGRGGGRDGRGDASRVDGHGCRRC